MTEWKLSLTIPGASEDEIERGLAAAQHVFDDADAIPYEAATEICKRDGEIEDLSEREVWLTEVWEQAETAAQMSCCPGKEPYVSGRLSCCRCIELPHHKPFSSEITSKASGPN